MRVVNLLLVLAVCACSSDPALPSRIGPDFSFDGFPTNFASGDMLAEAHFKANHAKGCRIDLIVARNVIPIWITVGLKAGKTADGEDRRSETTLIIPQQMDVRLYLPDGTALMPVADRRELIDSLDGDAKTFVSRRTFNPSVLETWSTARSAPNNGYVFFEIPPGLSIQGRRVRYEIGDAIRMYDLTEATVSLNVTIDNTLNPINVGVQ